MKQSRRLLYFLRVWISKIIRMGLHSSGSESQAMWPDPPTGLVVWRMHDIWGHPDSHGSPCSLTAGFSQCQWEAVLVLFRDQVCLSLVFNTRFAFCLLAKSLTFTARLCFSWATQLPFLYSPLCSGIISLWRKFYSSKMSLLLGCWVRSNNKIWYESVQCIRDPLSIPMIHSKSVG